MASRSLNKVILIGNLTRDPELRYTPSGTAVCTFGLATNRTWVTQTGETKEETEFHRIVAWNKLGELCAQLLAKGRKVYVEGRLSTHTWTGQDGTVMKTTEIVIEDMIILDSKKIVKGEEGGIPEETKTEETSAKEVLPKEDLSQPAVSSFSADDSTSTSGKGKKSAAKKTEKVKEEQKKEEKEEEITPEDIPF